MIKVGYCFLHVEVKFAAQVKAKLENVFKDVYSGELIKPHKYHMTLVYDRANPLPIDRAAAIVNYARTYKAKVSGFTVLGDAIVMLAESPDTQMRFDQLSLFMTHSFPDHLPHVSVYYADSPEAAKNMLPAVESALSGMIGTEFDLYGETFEQAKA